MSKKVISKILICPCHKTFLLLIMMIFIILFILSASVEGNIFYVLLCKDHPFRTRGDYAFDIEEKCSSKHRLSHKVCAFFFLLNTFWILSITKFVLTSNKLFCWKSCSFRYLFKKDKLWSALFLFSWRTRLIKVSLEKPYEDKIPRITDYRFDITYPLKILYKKHQTVRLKDLK